ncbi:MULTISPECIES: radical SAM protein [Aminobacterium]|jgi:putative pyruvate formate lyase activating enzyme|uniref:radical SAM protein n=1 Tax=Aminobacterium TaxID=81466 RepID=UPI0025795B97|nr:MULTISPECIES: radical SAM protein [unclassified Aminobacterium]
MDYSVDRFTLLSRDFEPAYLSLLYSGELKRRAERALADLESCTLCPRCCEANRLAGETGICKTGLLARVSSHFAHFGEEDCLRGQNGSGTIFFAFCNLNCVFCQNYEISHLGNGVEITPEQLAAFMLELQLADCHNINVVTPSHVVPQIIAAVSIAAEKGLRLPIVYNTSAYDSLYSLRLLDGIIDIYMPDFKIWSAAQAFRYLTAADYPEVACEAIMEMNRQVGDLKLDEHGLAKRGLLVRHLVMPGEVAGSEAILRFLAEKVSPYTYVNVMSQYHPAGEVSSDTFQEINRCPTHAEYLKVIHIAHNLKLRLDVCHQM